MVRNKTSSTTITEQTQIRLDETSQVHKHDALDDWTLCLQKAAIALENKLDEDEWKFFGNIYADGNVSFIANPSISLSVTIEHLIKDNVDLLYSEEKQQLTTLVVSKTGKLSITDTTSLLYYTLDFCREDKEKPNGEYEWTFEAFLTLKKTSIDEPKNL